MRRFDTKTAATEAVLAQLAFVVGVAVAVYGVSLWSRPLAFVLGGCAVAVVAFFIGYGLDKNGSRG